MLTFPAEPVPPDGDTEPGDAESSSETSKGRAAGWGRGRGGVSHDPDSGGHLQPVTYTFCHHHL